MTEWTAPYDEGPDVERFEAGDVVYFTREEGFTDEEYAAMLKQIQRRDSMILPADSDTVFFRWDPSDERKPIIRPIVPGRRGMVGYNHA